MSSRVLQGSRSLFVGASIVIGATLGLAPVAAFAKAEVKGGVEAVNVKLEGASVEEALKALGAAFDVRYQSTANLDRQITGTYRGSLQGVLRRVLDGFDFVLKTQQDSIEVRIIGKGAPGTAKPAIAVASVDKPATAVERPPVAASTDQVPLQVAALSVTSDQSQSAVPVPDMQLAEGGKSAAPMPTLSPATGSMPTPTPVTGEAASGPVPTPVPADSAAASGPVPTPIAPGSDAASGPMPMPTAAGTTVPGTASSGTPSNSSVVPPAPGTATSGSSGAQPPSASPVPAPGRPSAPAPSK
jgi:hypothetical protein